MRPRMISSVFVVLRKMRPEMIMPSILMAAANPNCNPSHVMRHRRGVDPWEKTDQLAIETMAMLTRSNQTRRRLSRALPSAP